MGIHVLVKTEMHLVPSDFESEFGARDVKGISKNY